MAYPHQAETKLDTPTTWEELESRRIVRLALGPEGFDALRAVGKTPSRYMRALLVERAAEWTQASSYLQRTGWKRGEILFAFECVGGIPFISSDVPIMLILSEALSAWGVDPKMRRRHQLSDVALAGLVRSLAASEPACRALLVVVRELRAGHRGAREWALRLPI